MTVCETGVEKTVVDETGVDELGINPIIAIYMHTNECNKMLPSCLFPHKVLSNSVFGCINSN